MGRGEKFCTARILQVPVFSRPDGNDRFYVLPLSIEQRLEITIHSQFHLPTDGMTSDQHKRQRKGGVYYPHFLKSPTQAHGSCLFLYELEIQKDSNMG